MNLQLRVLQGLGLGVTAGLGVGCLLVNSKNLETGLRTIRAGNPCTVLLRFEAIGFPAFGLYCKGVWEV